MDDDACAVNQEGSQVRVAAFADAQQVLLAATGVLPGHQTQPGCHLPAILEVPGVPKRGD